MQKLLPLFAIAALFFTTALRVHADEPAPASSGPAREEFKKLHKQYNDINTELRILQVEYRKGDKEKQPDLEKKWKEVYQKGEEMQPKYFAAAEKAYAEAPNADLEITKLLWKIFGYQANRDDYENAARLAKLLIDNLGNNPLKIDDRAFAFAGVAAVSVGDFKSAKTYFGMIKSDLLEKPTDPKDQHMLNAFGFSRELATLEKNWEDEQKIREAEAKADNLPRVLIKTDKGDITVELFENEAPNTVANFLTLVEKKFYDGLTFHRVLPGFMAQGGDPNGDGSGGPGYMIPDEVSNPSHRKHFRGSLSMAKSAAPNSGGSQFFLCFVPTSHLDGKHTVFGRVISGFDVLAKIQRRNPEDPNMADPDKIIEMKVLRPREHEYKFKKTGE